MQLALIKRYSHGFTVTSNYTLSKVEGDFGDADIIPYNMPQDPALLWGPLNQDHRHRFTTSWVLDLPGGNMAAMQACDRRLAVDGRHAVPDGPAVHRDQRHGQLSATASATTGRS